MSDKSETMWFAVKYYVIIFSLMMVVSVGVWLVKSYNEAKAFNEITGSNVTMRQAMWVQLRVDRPSDWGKNE